MDFNPACVGAVAGRETAAANCQEIQWVSAVDIILIIRRRAVSID